MNYIVKYKNGTKETISEEELKNLLVNVKNKENIKQILSKEVYKRVKKMDIWYTEHDEHGGYITPLLL